MSVAILRGYSLYQIQLDLLVLLAFTLVLTPFALFTFRQALRRAKQDGGESGLILSWPNRFETAFGRLIAKKAGHKSSIDIMETGRQ